MKNVIQQEHFIDKSNGIVLNNTLESFNIESDERLKNLTKLIMQSNHYDLKDFKVFDSMINKKIEHGVDIIIDGIDNSFSKVKKSKGFNEVAFIYKNYSFYKSHILSIFMNKRELKNMESKCDYILKEYIKTCIGEDDNDKPNYSYLAPSFGTKDIWMEFCSSLHALHTGYLTDYIEIRKKLIKCKTHSNEW